MREDGPAGGVYSSLVPRRAPASDRPRHPRGGTRARPRVHRRRHRPVRHRRLHRAGGGEAVITSFTDAAGLAAAVLGAASVLYLVYALIRPERF
jgi:K+-transporting ATPase KdpF subunit